MLEKIARTGWCETSQRPTRPWHWVGIEHISICIPRASFDAIALINHLYGYRRVKIFADVSFSDEMRATGWQI
jgi:hypothetical protein